MQVGSTWQVCIWAMGSRRQLARGKMSGRASVSTINRLVARTPFSSAQKRVRATLRLALLEMFFENSLGFLGAPGHTGTYSRS